MSDDFQLSDEERARLERLKRDLAPPPRIEAELIDALRRGGFVRVPRWPWAIPAILTAVAAGVIAALFVYRTIDQNAPVHQPEFVLLLYAGDDAGTGASRRD